MHGGDVFQINRRPVVDFENNIFDVLDFFDVATAPDEIFGRGDFKDAAADIGVAHLDRAYDVTQRNVVSDQRVGIEIDLVLLHEPTDRRDFRHAFHGCERIPEVPILNGTQLCEVMLSVIVNERVFVNPADARCVRANNRIHPFGQRAADRVEIFDDARTRPINVGAVLEDYVDERLAEHRFATDEFHFWRGNEEGGNGICDLVFHQVGRAAFPFRVNNYLHVAQVGNCVERRVNQPVNTARNSEDRENENEKFVLRARLDDALDQGAASRFGRAVIFGS